MSLGAPLVIGVRQRIRVRVALQEEGVDMLERASMRIFVLGPGGLDLIAEHPIIPVVGNRNLQQDRLNLEKAHQDRAK